MTDLERALAEIRGFDGVEHVLLVGDDGLLVQHHGGAGLDVEAAAAMLPALLGAAAGLGAVAGGALRTAVLELDAGVAVVQPLSRELVLAVLLARGVGFAPLLRRLRADRAALAALV